LVPNSQALTHPPNPQLVLPPPGLQLLTDKRISLSKSQGKAQTVHECDWAVREELLDHVFEFGPITSFELFWKTIGAVERDIW
jgi:hypothetical protein